LKTQGLVDGGFEERERVARVEFSGRDERAYFSAESGLGGLVFGEVVRDCCEDRGVVNARVVLLDSCSNYGGGLGLS
jgi:hypothetical protein